MKERLQAWLRRPGLPSVVARILLASGTLGFYRTIWFFISIGSFMIMGIALKVLGVLERSGEEFFVMLILILGSFAIPTLRVIRLMTQDVEQRPLASVGLLWGSHIFKEFLGGLVLGITVATLGFLSLYWAGTIQLRWDPVSLTPWLLFKAFVLVLGWLGVAFWEELYFRGYLLQTWASAIGVVPSVLITSIWFGFIHVGTYGMKPFILLDIALVGIVFSILYLKTKSLWAPIGMHFANNFWISHILAIPYEGILIPKITIDGQTVRAEIPRWFFQTELVGGKSIVDLYSWESLPSSLLLYGLLILLIWKLPLFRPHPEMEAFWQQYVPIAQPWAQLKAWWAKRKNKSGDAS